MTSPFEQLQTNTIDIQVVAEERILIGKNIDELQIETTLRHRILKSYVHAHKFSSLIKEICDFDTILYRLYAKVTVPIDKTTKQMFEFKPVPKTRFEYIIDDMD